MNETAKRHAAIYIESTSKKETELLITIIKTCLERDFDFRTIFADVPITIDSLENLVKK